MVLRGLAVVLVSTLALCGCRGLVLFGGGDGDNGTGPGPSTQSPGVVTPADCRTAEAFFDEEVYPRVFGATCIGCPTPAGAAAESSFHLVGPAVNDNHLMVNFATVSQLAVMKSPEHGNRSILELKPTLTVPHEGGEAVEPGSAVHGVLRDFISRVDGTPCDPATAPPLTGPFYDGVEFIAPYALLRRASFLLAGRLPTDAEISQVDSQGLGAVGPIVDAMMQEEAFLVRIKEGFSDVFLTAGYDDVGASVLSYEHFPNRFWTNSIEPDQDRYDASRLLGEAMRIEPMELIAYIVENDRPFTEILAGDYMVVSPYTARSYGIYDDVDIGFDPESGLPIIVFEQVIRGTSPLNIEVFAAEYTP